MKAYLIKMPFYGDAGKFFTVNKWYDVVLTPIMTHPITLKEIFFYIVKCDDGYQRKIDTEYFLTQEECRELKLIELGI